jgi:ABC-type nickel/cobalt efflux system permease component RcnA
MIETWSVRDRWLAIAVLTLLCLAVIAASPTWAQTNPFGGPRPPAAPAESGLVGWLLAKQNEFYRQFSNLIRAAKSDGSAVWTLLGVSFAYGIFHAAGPGHGKAVISSYLVANEETWRRGIVLSFASALLQAVVAVAVVGIAAVALQATARTMNTAVRWIEIASYAMIALIGVRLSWVKGRGLVRALSARRDSSVAHDHSHDPYRELRGPDHGHDHSHEHAHEDHAHGDHAHHHEHEHDHGHVHDAHCGHSHGPVPQELAGPGGWKRGLMAIVAVGLRPCSGAILVLVFALAQGLFWAGVASTFVMGLGTAITVAAIATLAVGARGIAAHLAARSKGDGTGTVIVRALETGAAVVVLVFGVALLLGYMATERMVGM